MNGLSHQLNSPVVPKILGCLQVGLEVGLVQLPKLEPTSKTHYSVLQQGTWLQLFLHIYSQLRYRFYSRCPSCVNAGHFKKMSLHCYEKALLFYSKGLSMLSGDDAALRTRGSSKQKQQS